ncbi:MAG: IS66 family insertion sequence element accessory protein TnpB [Myxococcota bacterium]
MDRLFGRVKSYGFDPYWGHLFVFLSKRRNRAKSLCWHPGDFVLWYKRIARGRFRRTPRVSDGDTLQIDSTELTLLLDGIDLRGVRRARMWEPKKSA